MEGSCFENLLLRFIENAVSEAEPHPLQRSEREFDHEEVVIAGWRLVPEAAFDHRENGLLLLPAQKRRAQMGKEFTAGHFEQVEVPRVIDMVAQSAFRIGDSM